MAFELTVEFGNRPLDLRDEWTTHFADQGIRLEIRPGFEFQTWSGGFLPMKLESLPQEYLFGLQNVVQISGFEVYFGEDSARFRSAMMRPIAELILQCFGAATLCIITNGTYHDPQTGEAIKADGVIERAKQEIQAYRPYIDEHSKIQHEFTEWADYQQP